MHHGNLSISKFQRFSRSSNFAQKCHDCQECYRSYETFQYHKLNSALDFLGFPNGMTLISQQIKNFLVLKKKLHRSKNKSFESEVDRVIACYNGFQSWQLLLQSTENDLSLGDPKRGRSIWILRVKKRWKQVEVPCIFEVTFTLILVYN